MNTAKPQTMKLVLIESARVLRPRLERLFKAIPGVDILANTPDWIYGAEVVARSHPDVVVVEVDPPMSDATWFIQQVAAEQPNTVIVALTNDSIAGVAEVAHRAGAHIVANANDDLEALSRFLFDWANPEGDLNSSANTQRKRTPAMANGKFQQARIQPSH